VARESSATKQEANLMDDQKNAIIEAAAKKIRHPNQVTAVETTIMKKTRHYTRSGGGDWRF